MGFSFRKTGTVIFQIYFSTRKWGSDLKQRYISTWKCTVVENSDTFPTNLTHLLFQKCANAMNLISVKLNRKANA